MIDTDELVRHNAEFAAGGAHAGLTLMPSGNLTIIGCVDPRVDPSHVLGLSLGEAAMIRNVGGRVTPETLRTLGMLSKVAQANSRPAGDIHYLILHHTGCGIRALAAFPDALAQYFEIPATELATKAVTDPFAAVRVDVEILKQHLPTGVLASGVVYDVTTGLIETVVPPARVTA